MAKSARFLTLFSGSSGNAALVEQDGRAILIDAGLSCKAIQAGLASAGLAGTDLAAILITHEHTDHVSGLRVFLQRYQVPLVASPETLDVLCRDGFVPPGADLLPAEEDLLDIEGFSVRGFSIDHDAAGCYGYRIGTPQERTMAIATDLGQMTEPVFKNLLGTSLVALESNFDPEMLRRGSYPAYLKKRISSDRGHLSNPEAAVALAALVAGGCKKVSLCHLSEENNQPALALGALEAALQEAGRPLPQDCEVQVAPRHQCGRWMAF